MKQITCLSELKQLKKGSILLWLPTCSNPVLEIVHGPVILNGTTVGYEHTSYQLRSGGGGACWFFSASSTLHVNSFLKSVVYMPKDIEEVIDYVPIHNGICNPVLIRNFIEQLERTRHESD